MNATETSQLASMVTHDIRTWVAFIGVLGAIVGSAVTIVGNFAFEWFRTREDRKLTDDRKELLKKMLNHPDHTWRKIETLSAVIGCDEERTKGYLIAIGARGSEKNDGKWGLISKHPLKSI